jgi:hypothetical protein
MQQEGARLRRHAFLFLSIKTPSSPGLSGRPILLFSEEELGCPDKPGNDE